MEVFAGHSLGSKASERHYADSEDSDKKSG